MNDELRKQRKEVLKRMEENKMLEWNNSKLKIFYEKNAKVFKKEESKKALIKILEYVQKTGEKVKLEKEEIDNMLSKLSKICDHEILVPGYLYNSYQCPICKQFFGPDKLPTTTNFIVGEAGYGFDHSEITQIKNALEKIIDSDDFLEELNETLSNIQDENENIKIRRRCI